MYIVAPNCRHLHRRLQREHHAGEEAGEQDDAERLDADLVHLLDDVTDVERTREDEAERLPGEGEIFLDRQDLRILAPSLMRARKPANRSPREGDPVAGKEIDRRCKGKGRARARCGSI